MRSFTILLLMAAVFLFACDTGFARAGEKVLVRINCLEKGLQVFVDGQPKGECSGLSMFLSPGQHKLVVRKDQADKTWLGHVKELTVYPDTVVKVVVDELTTHYTEEYYFGLCSERNAGECKSYLKKYPQGKYVKQVLKILEKVEKNYFTQCNESNLVECITYLSKYPQGKYAAQAKTIVGKNALEDRSTGIEFMWVEGECFQMGDTYGEGDPDEKPVHEVCVDGFYMGKYEVTQGQYERIMGSNPSLFKKGSNYPVERVSWNDVQSFIKKLNSTSKKHYSLPTEAQWEYAAREGGKKVRFGTGKDTIGPDEANFDASSKYKKSYSRSGQYRKQTNPVGTFRPNNLGLYDMSGNVWEWCLDWYDDDYYKNSPSNNPQGPSSGSYRVYRGGSWNYYPRHLRAADRHRSPPRYRNDYLGFRLVLVPQGR